ncbi:MULTISPECIES: hypothetical protein [Methylobacterium]|uniref:ABC-type sugar transport system substrate-binding protein n=2 Tax=Methylobacteriaceae TaxID=119045 RepID=A0ABV2NQ18_9HYPH|nr:MULTISPECIES: hypothetical protein [unclassified Methylobacterium]MBP2494667.1 ABC-type sugar transport system substrate-binding protein [Methylobacterium sp. PvP105]MBP2505462.1 ABC-type sugar transport system substrate-binding protein [Methylobacterium sp. PvP109]
MFLRIAALLLAVLLLLGALPAFRRADRARAEGRPLLTRLYESTRPWLAILAAAAIGLWLLSSR